jgi:hypothetical protein
MFLLMLKITSDAESIEKKQEMAHHIRHRLSLREQGDFMRLGRLFVGLLILLQILILIKVGEAQGHKKASLKLGQVKLRNLVY